MSRTEQIEDLQAVSQHVLVTADAISRLEAEKRQVNPGSPRFLELSDEIERLAEEIRGVSHAETGLAHEVADIEDLPTVAEADARS